MLSGNTFAQIERIGIKSYGKYDIKRGTFVMLGDSIFIAQKDTAIFLPDTVMVDLRYDLSKNNYLKSSLFYDSLRAISDKRLFTRELYGLLFSNGKQNSEANLTNNVENSEGFFIPFQGKIIRRIIIKRLDVFGTLIDDTSRIGKYWIEKVGNNAHINTRIWAIRNNLLFKKGEILNAYTLAENEVLLRKLPYIDDARIVVSSEFQSSDSVDVLVVTKDLWTIGIDGEMRSLENYKINLFDANFLGFGRRLDNTFYIDFNSQKRMGYKGTYRVDNLYGSFISSELSYINTTDEETFRFILSRDFVSQKIKYAGGLRLQRSIYSGFTANNFSFPLNISIRDVWMGKAFVFKNRNIDLVPFTKFVFSVRYLQNHYLTRPDNAELIYAKYYNSQFFISSFSLIGYSFYKSKLISGFGGTEDIPKGNQLSLIFGHRFSEFSDEPYAGAKFAKSLFSEKTGYYYGAIEVGAFIRSSQPENGCLKVDLNCFSPFYRSNRYGYRHFFSINYTSGYNRMGIDSININNTNGLRGLNNDNLYGKVRFSVKWESVMFTPWYFYGFHFAWYLFGDLASVGEHAWMGQNSFFYGIGTGIRIKNENLVFKTIELRFGYYPILPAGAKWYSFSLTQERGFSPANFEGGIPSVILYE